MRLGDRTYTERMPTQSDVILYELNEVPWEVVDTYCAARPESHLARCLPRSRSLTTLNEDPADLQPWRTWPTFHTGVYAEEHRSYELGQDPATFRGETVWEAAQVAGRRVGLFGPLQSWPAYEPENGGFYVPDTFAQGPETYPEGLSRFQAFNLAMTTENTFSASAPLNAGRMAATGADMLVRGLTPQSAMLLVKQLARERRDERWKAARPMAQVLPAFDLYWHLHRKQRPNLSIFFTNHVAGMMHRYWGDAMEDYAEEHDYRADEVFGTFLFEALDLFDKHLGRIVAWIDGSDTRLIIASSMGQAAIPYHAVSNCFVLTDPERLARALGLGSCEPALAMYPRYALTFETPAKAEEAAATLRSASISSEPLFSGFNVEGHSVSARIADWNGADAAQLSDGRSVGLEELGFSVQERLGGGNTAYHIPQGIWIEYGRAVEPDSSRDEFDVLEAKPRILDILGVRSAADSLSAG